MRGRLIERIDYLSFDISQSETQQTGATEGVSSWRYDTAQYGRGQLAGATSVLTTGLVLYDQGYSYDSLGRGSRTTTTIAGQAHHEQMTYDQYGRLFQVFDAARSSASFTDNGIERHYNSAGYLSRVTDAAYAAGYPLEVYSEVLAMNARGQVTRDRLGQGVVRNASYENDTGLLSNLNAGVGPTNYQNLTLTWDQIGNLTRRTQTGNSRNLAERFTYDGLNRLHTSTVTGQSAVTVNYDAKGNILSKTGVTGTWQYGGNGAGPHAVTRAGDATYRYDANGNNIHGDGRSLTYYTFDKPKSIIKGNHKVEFEYGPDRSRYYRKDTDTSTNRVTQTYYIGNVEKVSNPDGSQAWKRYLGNVIIEHKRNSAGVEVHKKAFYSLKDHLGSLNVLLEKRGSTFVLKDTLEFDPWGQRRAVNWSLMAQSAIAGQYFHNTSISNALGSAAYQSVTSRGFTGHEMLDEVGIIHMNGRIYDPKLGRFLQADSAIDGVSSTQGYNRYSYVHNNPLNAIDPSGHFSLRKYVGLIVAVIGGIFCPPCLAFGWQAFALGAFAGAAGAIANGADILAGALLGGVSGLAFAGVNGVEFGTGFGAELAQFASFGAVGGVTAVLAGGKFGHGFIAAGAGGTVGGKIGDIGGSGTLGPAIRTVARTILGGTISKLTGGKFANGAGAAAFASLLSEGTGSSRSKGSGASTGGSGSDCAGTACSAQDQKTLEALTVANPKSIKDNLEYGGLVYQNPDGSYDYTAPLPGTADGFDPALAAPFVPKGDVVVGDYHTHGDYSFRDTTGVITRTTASKDTFNSDNFSPSDSKWIKHDAGGNSAYRGYLGTPSGVFKVYDPVGNDYYEIK